MANLGPVQMLLDCEKAVSRMWYQAYGIEFQAEALDTAQYFRACSRHQRPQHVCFKTTGPNLNTFFSKIIFSMRASNNLYKIMGSKGKIK